MRPIGNGMAIYEEPPEQVIHTCPVCGANWLEVRDPDDPEWGVTYESDGIVTEEWPISKRCCIRCAAREATRDELMEYILDSDKQIRRDFGEWMLARG